MPRSSKISSSSGRDNSPKKVSSDANADDGNNSATANNINFKKLFENSYEGISLLNDKLRVIYRSPSAERITGWAYKDKRKTIIIDYIHPHDKQEVLQILKDILKTPGNSKTCKYRIQHLDGYYLWLDCIFTNMLDETDVKAIVCNFRDITKLQHTVNELMAYKYALDEAAIVAITDHHGKIEHVNKNFCGISKYQPDELLGHDHSIISSSYHSKAFIENLWVTIKQGKIWRGELKNRAKDGSLYWVDTTIVPFVDEKNEPYQYLSIRSDITRKKLVELELKKKADLIDKLLESMTDGFIVLDEDMQYVYANKQIGKILGVNENTLLGKNIWEMFPDTVGSATYNAIQSAFKNREYVCNEDFYAPLNLWQENRVFPFDNGVSVFIRDITTKKQEEHRLKLLESVITNTTDAILITEAEPLNAPGPRILYVNEAFTKMTGYAANEVVGQTPRILQGPKTNRKDLDRLKVCLETWQPCAITLVNYKKNGEEFWINLSVNPVADEKGLYTHWIAIQHDVTQRLNYIKAIEEQNQKLREISWMQSHIIRAPLSRIMGLIQLIDVMKIKDLNDETIKILNYILMSATELDEVIKNISDKSKVNVVH